jgi:membrane protein DedA with SNARE-associated domain
MNSSSIRTRKKSRTQLLHQYYKYTGFYDFLGTLGKKSIVPLLSVIAIIFIFDRFVYDIGQLIEMITNTYSALGVISFFFLSECVLGLITPELFIAWASKTGSPYVTLTILAFLSYLSGIINYGYGVALLKLPKVREYIDVKISKHIKNIKKWGGLMIIVGALSPLPYTLVSMACGLINYSFKNYLLFSVFRIIRFYLYALLIFNII